MSSHSHQTALQCFFDHGVLQIHVWWGLHHARRQRPAAYQAPTPARTRMECHPARTRKLHKIPEHTGHHQAKMRILSTGLL